MPVISANTPAPANLAYLNGNSAAENSALSPQTSGPTSPDAVPGLQADQVNIPQSSSILQSPDAVWAQITAPSSVPLDSDLSSVDDAAAKARLSTADLKSFGSLATLTQTSQLPLDLLNLLQD
jgi:hypothetical protein